MNNQFDASKLLATLAERDASKRHAAQDDPTVDTTLLITSKSAIIAWLRSLAPLTDKDIYNNSWKD